MGGTGRLRRGSWAGRRAGRLLAAVLTAGAVLVLAGGCDFGVPSGVQAPPSFDCFHIQDPYAVQGMWHRANLHMHSDHSDGALRADQLVDLYFRNGYTLLCISDHDQYGDQDGGILPQYQTDDVLHDWNGDGATHAEHRFGSGVEAYVRDYGIPPAGWARDTWFRSQVLQWDDTSVVLPGAEMTRMGWHFGVVGLPSGPLEPPDAGQGYVQRAHAAGGFVYLAHPGEWNAAPDQLAHLVDISRLDGIEILNGLRLSQVGSDLTTTKAEGSTSVPGAAPMEGRPTPEGSLVAGSARDCAGLLPPDATPLWDALLARGYRLWGLANDDCHTWQGAPDAYPFTAFEMVLTPEPTADGFLAALHAGSFYGSTGLYFREVGVHGDSVVAWAPSAERLRFVGWGGQLLLETNSERAAYLATGAEGYVRVEAEGALVRGHTWKARAWSQPFYLEAASCGSEPAKAGPD